MTRIFLLLAAAALPLAAADVDPYNPYNLTDCRNETSPEFGDASSKLRVLSWHIHYTTNTSDQSRFYYDFLDHFSAYTKGGDHTCSFGPNFGSEEYPYICSLESAPEEAFARKLAADFEAVHGQQKAEVGDGPYGGDPWGVPQRAFFVPNAYKEEAWTYAQEIQGYLDILLHPNTGCMHDDHSVRANWVTAEGRDDPDIYVLEFPCNDPATGCNDEQYSGSPSCGCTTPLASDAPEDSCENCVREYYPSDDDWEN